MDASKLSSQELLRLCLQLEDESLWLEFVRRVQPVIARVVVKSIRRWTLPTASLADDLVQETYMKLYSSNRRALRSFDCRHENALFGFVKVVASNVVQDHFRNFYSQRRGGGKNEDLETVTATKAVASTYGDDAEHNIKIAEIARCLELHAADPNFERDRTIFWLYYQQGLTAKAISEMPGMGLTLKGVESTLLRLTRMVRENLHAKPGSSEIGASGSA